MIRVIAPPEHAKCARALEYALNCWAADHQAQIDAMAIPGNWRHLLSPLAAAQEEQEGAVSGSDPAG